MSTLKVSQIQSLTTIQSSATLIPPVISDANGTEIGMFCRVWVTFTGSTAGVTINRSVNVSSVTREGIGQYTINYSITLPGVNNAIVYGGNRNQVGNAEASPNLSWSDSTQTSVRIGSQDNNTDNYADAQISVAVIR